MNKTFSCKYKTITTQDAFCTARQKECLYPTNDEIQKCEKESNTLLRKQYSGFEYIFDKPVTEPNKYNGDDTNDN